MIRLSDILSYRRETTIRVTDLRTRREETLRQYQRNEQERRAIRLRLESLNEDFNRLENDLMNIDFELETLKFQATINARTENRLRRKIDEIVRLFQERQEEAQAEADVVRGLISQISKAD